MTVPFDLSPGAAHSLAALSAIRLGALLPGAHVFRPWSGGGPPAEGLAGVPFAVKDNIDVAGFPTTGGTRALLGHVPRRDAHAVALLRAVGGVPIGKTAMHELGHGITGVNPTLGNTRHPEDEERSAGGSSGGSAVAVAVGAVPFALGTDTGGSARIPAGFTGVVGFRPTTGRYPGEGTVGISWTRDSIGVLAASVAWVRAVDRVLAPARRLPAPARAGLGELCFGAWEDDWGAETAPGVARALTEVVTALEARGARVTRLPGRGRRDRAVRAGLTILDYESPRALPAYLDGAAGRPSVAEVAALSESPDVREILRRTLDRPVSAAEYRAALAERDRLIAEDVEQCAAAGVDALLSPTAACEPPLLSETELMRHNGAPRSTLLTVVGNATPASVIGGPALSLPLGRSRETGLPVGLTIEGRPGSDEALLAIGALLEQGLPWHGAVARLPSPRPGGSAGSGAVPGGE